MAGFLGRPLEVVALEAVAVPGEKAAAMLQEQGPKFIAVGARHVESGHFGVIKKTESALAAGRRQLGQARQNLE